MIIFSMITSLIANIGRNTLAAIPLQGGDFRDLTIAVHDSIGDIDKGKICRLLLGRLILSTPP